MTTTKELADALLKIAGQAADGSADIHQAATLCKCTDTLIKLARLQIEVSDGRIGNVHWLKNSDVDPDRRTNLLMEKSTLEKALKDDKLDESTSKRLKHKLDMVNRELQQR